MALVLLTIDSICLILFTLGFIGNLLGLIVFSSRRFRCCSTYAILALASFSINLVCIIRYSLLLHSKSRLWLSEKIVSSHWISCKIYRLSSSVRVLAAWVTVFWVIERFVYVTSRLHVFLYRRKMYSQLKKYRFILMIIIALTMVLIVTGPTIFFFSPNLDSVNVTMATIQCTYDHHRVLKPWQNYFDNLSFGWNYHTIRCLFSELIPSLLVAIFNAGIIACILCRTAQVRRQQEQFHHRNQLSMSIGSGSTTKLPGSSPLHMIDRNQVMQRHNSLRASTSTTTTSTNSVPFGKMSWMNIVLLFHSLLFFFSSSISSLVFFSTSDIFLAHWVSVIILANCSLNFYIYCLSGQQFRRELKRIAKRYIRHIHKAFLRKRYSIDDQRSPIHQAKNNIYQPVANVKQRQNILTVPNPHVRTYPGPY